MRFRKKPVEVDAVQWTGDNRQDVTAFTGITGAHEDHDKLLIQTLEGDMTASRGDWIIKGVQGEFYPCKPDIFTATYEPVQESDR